jgi:hypothetical protein
VGPRAGLDVCEKNRTPTGIRFSDRPDAIPNVLIMHGTNIEMLDWMSFRTLRSGCDQQISVRAALSVLMFKL